MIAVNPSFTPAMARISVPGLGTCGLRVWGDGRWIVARNGVFKDYLRCLGVRIYVTPPPGFVLRGSDFSQTPPFCRRNGEVRLNGKVRIKPDPT